MWDDDDNHAEIGYDRLGRRTRLDDPDRGVTRGSQHDMSTYLIVDLRTFRLGGVGPSTGELWLVLGDVAFPAPHWDDFVVVILEAWTAALLRILKGAAGPERVHFMEGPYEVEATRAGEKAVRLRALERGSIERACVDVPLSLLLADALTASDAVVSACRRAGDTSPDVQRLERALVEMRATGANATPSFPYGQLSGLEELYLEDSYVLGIQESPGTLTFEMDLVLREQHPAYAAPPPGVQYCYRRGRLTFRGVRGITWLKKRAVDSWDASGQADMGNIDSFVLESGRYELEGDWGHVVLRAATVDVELA